LIFQRSLISRRSLSCSRVLPCTSMFLCTRSQLHGFHLHESSREGLFSCPSPLSPLTDKCTVVPGMVCISSSSSERSPAKAMQLRLFHASNLPYVPCPSFDLMIYRAEQTHKNTKVCESDKACFPRISVPPATLKRGGAEVPCCTTLLEPDTAGARRPRIADQLISTKSITRAVSCLAD
jgi:hypothetical protein